MKLVYAANIRIPTEKAHGFQIMKMCESFAQNGADITLVVPTRKNILSDKDPFEFYGVKNNFTIQRVKMFNPRFLMKLPGGLYPKIQSYFFAQKIISYMKDKEESVLYCRDAIVIFLLSQKIKKIVWECHSIPNKIQTYAKGLKDILHIFVLTSSMRTSLIEQGIKENNISVTPDSVDLKAFDSVTESLDILRNQLNLPKDRFIVSYIGKFTTLGKDKGITDLLKAKKHLNSLGKSSEVFILCVGGSSDEIKVYETQAHVLGLTKDDFALLPMKPFSDVARYCKASDVLAMPFPNIKHYAHFMSPLKMFEYMASKRPLISSDLPSVRDVLNENNCIFCKPDDPKDLANKILFLLKSEDKGVTIARQAYEDVQEYSWKNRGKRILEVILKI